MTGKIFGAVLIILGCGFFGFSVTAQVKREENALNKMKEEIAGRKPGYGFFNRLTYGVGEIFGGGCFVIINAFFIVSLFFSSASLFLCPCSALCSAPYQKAWAQYLSRYYSWLGPSTCLIP